MMQFIVQQSRDSANRARPAPRARRAGPAQPPGTPAQAAFGILLTEPQRQPVRSRYLF